MNYLLIFYNNIGGNIKGVVIVIVLLFLFCKGGNGDLDIWDILFKIKELGFKFG